MKFKSVALASILLAFFSTGGVKASTLTYNLVLTNTSGPENGVGSFTINGPVASTGVSVFTAGSGLTSLNFTIDGSSFSLSNALVNASVIFSGGNLTSIAYLGAANGFQLDLGTLGLSYAFVDLLNSRLDSAGNISASSVSATPLPSSWTLMLIGLAGGGLVAYRRKNKMSFAPA